MSRHALERAGRIADGWLAQYAVDELSEERLAGGVEVLRAAATAAGRGRDELDRFRIVVRVTGADRKLESLAARLGSLAGAGATDLIVDVDWDDEAGPRRSFETLRSAVSQA